MTTQTYDTKPPLPGLEKTGDDTRPPLPGLEPQPVKKKETGSNGSIPSVTVGSTTLNKAAINPKDYETVLTPDKEKQFGTWLDNQYKIGNIHKGDYEYYKSHGYGYDYDFRAAFENGEKPAKNGHWSDIGKKPNHETFSNESKYNNVNGNIGGHWEGNTFIPPNTQNSSIVTNKKDDITGLKYFDITPEQVEAQLKHPFHTGGENPSIDEDPIKHVLQPWREQANTAKEDARLFNPANRNVSESTGQKGINITKPNQAAQAQIDANKSAQKYADVTKQVVNTVFPNGKVAENYLKGAIVKHGGTLPQDNETINIAANKAANYEYLKEKVNQIPDLTQLAVQIQRENDPNLNEQISEIEKDKGIKAGSANFQFGDLYQNILPGVVQGAYVDRLINDPDMKEIANETPLIKAQYDQLKNGGVYTQFQDYGEIVARRILSQEYEKRKSNLFANPIFDKSTYLNHLSDEVFKDNPSLKAIVDARLKGNWEGKIDTKGLVDEFGTGAKHTYEGMGNTFRDLIGAGPNAAERIEQQLIDQNSQISSGVKGWQKNLGTASNFLGMMSAMGTASPIAKGLGMSTTAANAAIAADTFGDQELNNWTMKYPSEPWKAHLGAILSTLAYAAPLKTFNSTKVAEGIANKMEPTIKEAINKLDQGAIESEVSKGYLGKFGEALKGTGEATAHMVAVNVAQHGLDHVLGLDDQTYNKYHPDNEIVDVAKNMIIGSAFPQFIMAHGATNEVANSLYSIADNQQRSLDVLQSMADKDPSLRPEVDKKIEDINFLADQKRQLDQQGISIPNQKKFLLEVMKEKYAKENIANTPESAVARKTQKEIIQSQDVRDKIINGEDVAGDEVKAGLSPQENAVIDAIKEKADLAKEPQGSMGRTIFDAAQDPNNHKQIIKELVDQSSDPEALEMNVGKKITDAVLDLPEKSKQKTADEVKAEVNAASEKSPEQAQTEQPGEATLSIEEQPEEKDVTSIKNEITRQHRENLGLKNEIPAAEKEFGQTWQEAKDKIAAGTDPQDLVNELKKKPRPLTDVENALLLHHQNTKEIQLNDTNEAINKAAESGNEADLAEAKTRKARLLDELQDIYDVNKAVGTENARGLASRKMMADRQYSLTNMIAEKRATANDGKPLSEEQQKEVEALHQKITETQQAFDDYVKKAQAEISELQEKILKKPIKDKKSAAQKIRDLADKIEKSNFGKANLPEGTQTQGASFDLNKAIADGMRVIAAGLEKGGDLIDLIKESVDDFIKTNPDEDAVLFKQKLNKSLIDASITVDKKTIKEDYSGIVHDKEAFKLRAKAQRAKNEADISLKKDELKKRTIPQKVQDAFIKWQRAFKLSNPLTLGKLSMAALTRATTDPLEQVVGGAYSAVLPKLAEGSSEGGGLNVKVQATAMKEGLMQGMKDAADIMKKKSHGKSDLDVVFGKGGQLPPEAVDFFGQLHSAIKAPVKRFAFERSLQKRIVRNMKAGVDVHDPMVQSEMAIGAYKDANRAIFMQDNAVATGWQRMIRYLETVDPKTGKAPAKGVATGLQWMLPFVKVPTNIAAEIGTNVYGVPVGIAKLVYGSFQKGMENLSPDEKDVILRNLKKGSLGLAAMSLGYMNPQTFGGYYQDKEKRGPNDAKPNSVKLFGINIPAWLVESPIFQAMEIGATVRRVKDTVVHGNPKGLSEGLWAGGLGLAEHVPMIGQGVRVNKLFTSAEDRKYYVGELAKSTLVPAFLDYVAKSTDPADEGSVAGKMLNPDNKRKPETTLEHIESAIPGLREKVPLKPTAHNKNDETDPAFKYFIDKGLSLPNTANSSEIITDEKAHTKKKLSDYPEDIQNKYEDVHKEILKKELQSVVSKGAVYVKEYKDAKGEEKNEISLKPTIHAKRKRLDDLNENELTQVLHLAQGEATKVAKKKIFHN